EGAPRRLDLPPHRHRPPLAQAPSLRSLCMSSHWENEFAARWVNLADPRLGAKVVHATDEFFAPAERMLNHEPAVFVPGKYDDHAGCARGRSGDQGRGRAGGKPGRTGVEGHAHCIVRRALPGIVRGGDIDPSHFTGNYPPAASIDACRTEGDPDAATRWTEIL